MRYSEKKIEVDKHSWVYERSDWKFLESGIASLSQGQNAQFSVRPFVEFAVSVKYLICLLGYLSRSRYLDQSTISLVDFGVNVQMLLLSMDVLRHDVVCISHSYIPELKRSDRELAMYQNRAVRMRSRPALFQEQSLWGVSAKKWESKLDGWMDIYWPSFSILQFRILRKILTKGRWL